jgi:hypothetical protein
MAALVVAEVQIIIPAELVIHPLQAHPKVIMVGTAQTTVVLIAAVVAVVLEQLEVLQPRHLLMGLEVMAATALLLRFLVLLLLMPVAVAALQTGLAVHLMELRELEVLGVVAMREYLHH